MIRFRKSVCVNPGIGFHLVRCQIVFGTVFHCPVINAVYQRNGAAGTQFILIDAGGIQIHQFPVGSTYSKDRADAGLRLIQIVGNGSSCVIICKVVLFLPEFRS